MKLMLAVAMFFLVCYGAHDASTASVRRPRSKRKAAPYQPEQPAAAQVVALDSHHRRERTLTRRYH